MSKFYIDDGIADHPKLLALSADRRWGYIEALCYCRRRLTDGEIPSGLLDPATARALMKVGLLERIDGRLLVHDYLDWNLSRVDVEGSREQARERMREVRTNSNGTSKRSSGRVQRERSGSALSSTPEGGSGGEPMFVVFWRTYPRRVGKRAASLAFDRAVKRAPATSILEGAQRLATDPNLPETRFIPHPTTWLNRDGWEDDPLPPQTGSKASKTSRLLALADRMEEGGQ